MFTFKITIASIILAIAATASPARADEQNDLIGVWRITIQQGEVYDFVRPLLTYEWIIQSTSRGIVIYERVLVVDSAGKIKYKNRPLRVKDLTYHDGQLRFAVETSRRSARGIVSRREHFAVSLDAERGAGLGTWRFESSTGDEEASIRATGEVNFERLAEESAAPDVRF